jgi:hypothetical protein
MKTDADNFGNDVWLVKAKVKFSLAFIMFCSILMIDWKEWTVYLFSHELKIHFPRQLGLMLIEGTLGGILAKLPVEKLYRFGMLIVLAAVGTFITINLKPNICDSPILKSLIIIFWAVGIILFLICMRLLFRNLGQQKLYLRWRKAALYLAILYLYSIFFLFIYWLDNKAIENTFMIFIFKLMVLFTGFKIIDAFLESIILKWDDKGLISYTISKYNDLKMLHSHRS